MTAESIPALLPLLALTGAVVASLVSLRSPGGARWVAVAVTGSITVLGAVGLARVLDGDTLVQPVGGWAAPLGIEYVLDALSGTVVVLVGAISTLAVLYPTKVGFGNDVGRGVALHAVVLMLVAGLLGATLTGDLFHLFVSLEVYSIASYALVAMGGPAAAVASYRYLLIGTVGSSLYLLGVGYLYFTTGTLSMSELGPLLEPIIDSPTVAGAVALITIGLGVKMALFPLHVWLPDAHSQAPPAVAALLAAVQVKVAAYALIRILFDVLPAELLLDQVPVLDLLTWFGTAGVLVGSVMAIRQTDLKRLLAHSTVAQIGYIAVGIGLANPLALVGALLHVVNHAVMKSCLFFAAGSVLEQAGTKKIAGLAGLGQRLPWTMAAFTAAAVSMVGLPPTAGFFSKWYLITGAIDGDMWVVALVLAAATMLTLAYFLRLIEQIWFRSPVSDTIDVVRESRPMVLAPMVTLTAAILIIGLLNAFLVDELLDPLTLRLVG